MIRRDLAAEEDTFKYRKRLNELYQERKDLVNNIKTLNKRKKLIING
jgi:cell division protein FtsB